jgi:hypothetical protein
MAVLALTAGPATAGLLYVPVATNTTNGEFTYQTRLWASNLGEQSRPFTATYLATNTDGTARTGNPGNRFPVASGRTAYVSSLVQTDEFGMVELNAAPQLSVSARLVVLDGAGQLHGGAWLPVVSSDNDFAAAETAHLQGLARDADWESDLGIINLASVASQCTVKLFKADGSAIGSAATVPTKPLSQLTFADVLGQVQAAAVTGARAEVSCDQPFYAYATLQDSDNGRVQVVSPSQTGASTLTPPGGTPGDDDDEPPPGGLIWRQPQPFIPNKNEPEKIYTVPAQEDQRYSKVTVEMDVTMNGWYSKDPEGMHSIFWLQRGDKWRSNMIGFCNARGPNKNFLYLMSNLNNPPGVKQIAQTLFSIPQNQKYHVSFRYDTPNKIVELKLLKDGAEIVKASTPPTANAVFTVAPGGFLVQFGFQDYSAVGPERPTYGWVYENFVVKWFR